MGLKGEACAAGGLEARDAGRALARVGEHVALAEREGGLVVGPVEDAAVVLPRVEQHEPAFAGALLVAEHAARDAEVRGEAQDAVAAFLALCGGDERQAVEVERHALGELRDGGVVDEGGGEDGLVGPAGEPVPAGLGARASGVGVLGPGQEYLALRGLDEAADDADVELGRDAPGGDEAPGVLALGIAQQPEGVVVGKRLDTQQLEVFL